MRSRSAFSDKARANATPELGRITSDRPASHLLDGFEPRRSMGGKLVQLFAKEATLYLTTNAEGVATGLIPFNAGANLIRASYAGDTYYEPSESSQLFFEGPGGTPELEPPPASHYRGRDFIGAWGAFASSGSYPISVQLASDHHTVAIVDAPLKGTYGPTYRVRIPVEVHPGRIATVALPNSSFGSAEVSRFVTVSAPQDITASLTYDKELANAWADQLIPESALGTDHRLAGATALVLSGPVGPFVHAVAVEDETHLTFVPNYPVATSAGVFQAGQTIQVTLGRHQSFYARATALPGDFSGSSLTSDRPVAVFSGVPIADMNGCVNPADPKGTRCDPVFEQIPPVDSLGRAFVATQSLGKTADLVRVVAAEDATEVRVNGVLSSVISRGQFSTIPIPAIAKVVHVTTTRPALGVQHGGPLNPYIAILPPLEQLVPSSLLFARVDGPLPSIDSSLHLVAPSASVGSIFLDGELTVAAWTPVAASRFSATSLPISPGLHRVDSMSPSVLVSGTTYGSRTRNTLGSSAESRLTRIAGDRLDNDCDGRIDEELANFLDDDADFLADKIWSRPIRSRRASDRSELLADARRRHRGRADPRGLRPEW